MSAMWIPKRLVEIGLINTAAEAPASFVSHCEIEYESRIHAAAQEIMAAHCKVVMLTGPSASGKTTTTNKIAQSLIRAGVNAVVVSLDDFYHNLEDYPYLPDGTKDYENITALDINEIHRCLLELINKGKSDFPEFDFQIETRKEKRNHIELEGGVVLVEGIHALNPILTSVLPQGSVYKIYAGLREEYSKSGQRFLSTKDIRLARRMVRDNKFRGHSLEKTIQMWPNVCEGEDIYIKAYKPYADLLMDTTFSYEICVLAPYVISFKGGLDGTAHETRLNSLIHRFEKCSTIPNGFIPPSSMLREFVGTEPRI